MKDNFERTVVSTFSAPRSSGWSHYAGSVLSCGHNGTCDLKPTVYACGSCGYGQTQCSKCEACEYNGGFRIVFLVDAIRPEDRLTQPGEVQVCSTCSRHSSDIERLRSLSEPVFRARYSERWGGQYHLYRRDETSPTGVMHIMTVSATPAIDELLREKRISPLSPTEDRYAHHG